MVRPSFVYVIGAPGESVVKIGRSIAPARRLAELRVNTARPLEILATFPGGSQLEAALHRAFADIRAHSEWFDFADRAGDVVQLVTAAVRDAEWDAELSGLVREGLAVRCPLGRGLLLGAGWDPNGF